MRIVATSNRRHLMPQSAADNRAARLDEHGDLHMGEAIDEKLALSDRFGLVLGFYAFDQATYLRIVEHYAARPAWRRRASEIHARGVALGARARRAVRGARRSQFVDDFAGREALARGAADAREADERRRSASRSSACSRSPR